MRYEARDMLQCACVLKRKRKARMPLLKSQHARSSCTHTWAASSRSAGVPWRSPLLSFLKAYERERGRFMRYCPFIASSAASAKEGTGGMAKEGGKDAHRCQLTKCVGHSSLQQP